MPKTARKPASIGDLMRTGVVSVRRRDTLADAIYLMTENHVSGLPVVDAKGRCVGVITMSDVLSFVEEQQEAAEGTIDEDLRYYDPDGESFETIALSAALMDEYGSTPIEDIMSRDVISVTPEASVEAVAKLMVKHNVHRIVVLDSNQRLLGIMSAFDVVRYVAKS